MKTLFRYEDRDGLGPYNGITDWGPGRTGHNHLNGHPTLYHESDELFVNFRPGKHVFGFVNTKQLARWFTKEERRSLFRAGYRLKKILVGDAHASNYQAIGIPRNILDLP